VSTPEKQEARRLRYRRGYAALALLSLVVGGLSIGYAAHETSEDNAHWHQALMMQQRDLCGVVGPFADTPMTKPTSPSQKTTTTTYAWHERFVTLSREFHC
jgi:hypothetical protein